MRVLLVVAGPVAAEWVLPSLSALGTVAGAGAVEWVDLRVPAGRDEIDPLLGGLDGRRLVLLGAAASVGDVLTRLVRRDALDVPLGVVLVGEPASVAWRLGVPVDPVAAARVTVTGAPRAVDLVRDDGGGVLVDRVRLRSAEGRLLGTRAYADSELVADGGVRQLDVERTGSGTVRLVAVGGRLPPGRTQAEAEGRAVQVSCAPARLTVDGREHPRPVIRRNWWVEPGRWTLVLPR